jgi:hypothetical protein
VRSPRPYYTLSVTSQHKRAFSNASHQRGIWDEDDEVPEPAPTKRSGRPLQPTQPVRARPTTHRHIGGLLRSRFETKHLAENYAILNKRFNSLPLFSHFVELFIQLKYKNVDDLLSECELDRLRYELEHQALSSSFKNQVTALISRITNRVLEAEEITQLCVSELKSLSNSMEQRRDYVIARNTNRIFEANVVTQECVAEWETLSFSILKRIATVVSQNTDRVSQAERITQSYIAEVTHLSSSMLGLERIQAAVSKAEKSNKTIDHDFCATVFTQTSKWTQELEQLEETIQGWQRDLRVSKSTMLEPLVNISEISIRRLRKTLRDGFLRPRKTARKHIDDIIRRYEEFQTIYEELQLKSSIVRRNQFVKMLCAHLEQSENLSLEDRLAFRNFITTFDDDSSEFGQAAHMWRSAWRESWRLDNNLQESQFWNLKDFTSSFPTEDPTHILTNYALSAFDPNIPRILENNAIEFSDQLQQKYNSLWKFAGARSPELQIYWRQLDVIAPIQLVDLLTWRLSCDVWYLYISLRGECGRLWAWIPTDEMVYIAQRVRIWSNQFQAHRSDLRALHNQFIDLNWLRLQSESKLHSMKEPVHLSGRFEIINPLSQDPSRFAQWTEQMARYAGEAYIYQCVGRVKPLFWETLYDKLEAIDTTPSLALRLHSSMTPKPMFIKSIRDKHERYPRIHHHNNTSHISQRSILPRPFSKNILTVWLESKLNPPSSQGGDQAANELSPGLRMELEARIIPIKLKSDWLEFKNLAILEWRSWAKQHGSKPTTGPSLQHPEDLPKEFLKKFLSHPKVNREDLSAIHLTNPISAAKGAQLAFDSFHKPDTRLALEKKFGPPPAPVPIEKNPQFPLFERNTHGLWTNDRSDSRHLPVLTQDVFNDWQNFQHLTWRSWGLPGGLLTKKSQRMLKERQIKDIMCDWVKRQQPLYEANSSAIQGTQRENHDSLKCSKVGSKHPLAEPTVNQGSQEDSPLIYGPSPSPSDEPTKRCITDSEFKNVHDDRFHSMTTRKTLMPHEMAQLVQLVVNSDAKPTDISPTQMGMHSIVDAGSQAVAKSPLTPDQVFKKLFSVPKRQDASQIRNNLPGVRPQSGSHHKAQMGRPPRIWKSGSVSAGKRPQNPSAAVIFGHEPRNLNGREYSTIASSDRVSCQQTRDVSDVSLSDQSLGDDMSPVTSTNPRSVEESVSTDESISSTDADSSANASASPLFWSHSSQQGPNGQKLVVHYCRTLRSTEDTIPYFLGSKVIGFDMEWKSSASSWDSIQNNVSLIQIANEERIALFHIALFKPARTLDDLVSPSLKRLIESPDVTKVGVAIKADCTRLRKFLGIDAQATFELSHLFKLVKHGKDNPKLVNKRGVNLSDQVEEHFGLPLDKSEDVRCGDWTRPLTYRKVQCEW